MRPCISLNYCLNDGSVRFKVLFMEMCVLLHMAGVYRRTFKIAVVLSAPAASAGALHTLPPLRTAITTFLETSERARERQHSFLARSPQQASICLPLRERSTRSAFRPWDLRAVCIRKWGSAKRRSAACEVLGWMTVSSRNMSSNVVGGVNSCEEVNDDSRLDLHTFGTKRESWLSVKEEKIYRKLLHTLKYCSVPAGSSVFLNNRGN